MARSMMKTVFLGRDEPRLRAGWRILLQILLLMVFSMTVMGLMKLAFDRMPGSGASRDALRGLLLVAVATPSVALCRRWLDRRSWRSMGLQWDRLGALDLLFGFLLSIGLVVSVFLVLKASGSLRVDSLAWQEIRWGSLVGTLALQLLAVGITVGWWEELVFRGYWLQNLRDGLGYPVAVAISIALYGLLHMGNPNAGWLSGLMIALIGVVRIQAWAGSGRLWLGMGMHAGWTFAQGPLFGFGVSGHEGESLVRHTLDGPTWLTGGPFGPEASLLTIPVVFVALLAIHGWTRGRRFDPRVSSTS